ncbi:MAG: hypothetical protein ABIJ75_05875 [Actinomycetota bacterium]
MSPDQRAWLEKYIAAVQEVLYLGHWRIIISDVPADPNTYAQIKPTVCRDAAVLKVADDLLGNPPDVIRDSIVHELIHCIMEPIRWVMINGTNELSRSAAVIHEENHHDAMELATDRLARAVAPAAPLPEGIPN